MINRKLLLFFDHCEAAAFHVETKIFGKDTLGAWSSKFIINFKGMFFLTLVLGIFIVSEQTIKLPFPIIAIPILIWYIYFSFFLDIPRKTTQHDILEAFLKLSKRLRILFYFISFTPTVLLLAILAFVGIKYLQER